MAMLNNQGVTVLFWGGLLAVPYSNLTVRYGGHGLFTDDLAFKIGDSRDGKYIHPPPWMVKSVKIRCYK